MSSYKVLLLCAFLCVQKVICQIEYRAEESCQTVEGGVGKCIALRTCTPYVALLQQKPRSPNVIPLLKAAHCGFDKKDPIVCCPQSSDGSLTTPIANEGSFRFFDDINNTTIHRFDTNSTFLMPPFCGIANDAFGKVVGGKDAEPDAFCYVDSWRCGGSLVSHRHVLTAAHCIHNQEKDLYVVRLGELNLERDDEAWPIDVLIKRAIKHEEYDIQTYSNDIGLLILEKDIQFTVFIRPICLPTQPDLLSNSFINYNPRVAGWGRTLFRGPRASRLQVARLLVMDNSLCAKSFSDYPAIIDERVLCVGVKAGGRDVCQGDSGGPLIQRGRDPELEALYFYQIGIIAYGRGCAQAGFPGVYMRVTHYLPWIETYMFQNND